MLAGICQGSLVPRSGATDSKPNPLGNVPSAPSHRNRGAAREEIYQEPVQPNAIPPGRREECRDDLTTGKTQVVVIKCRVRRKGRCILHNRYRARSGIHRRAVRASRLARQRPRYPAALVGDRLIRCNRGRWPRTHGCRGERRGDAPLRAVLLPAGAAHHASLAIWSKMTPSQKEPPKRATIKEGAVADAPQRPLA